MASNPSIEEEIAHGQAAMDVRNSATFNDMPNYDTQKIQYRRFGER